MKHNNQVCFTIEKIREPSSTKELHHGLAFECWWEGVGRVERKLKILVMTIIAHLVKVFTPGFFTFHQQFFHSFFPSLFVFLILQFLSLYVSLSLRGPPQAFVFLGITSFDVFLSISLSSFLYASFESLLIRFSVGCSGAGNLLPRSSSADEISTAEGQTLTKDDSKLCLSFFASIILFIILHVFCSFNGVSRPLFLYFNVSTRSTANKRSL